MRARSVNLSHCGKPPRVKGYGLRGCELEPGARDGMCCCGCVACDLVCVILGSRAPSFARSYQLELFYCPSPTE